MSLVGIIEGNMQELLYVGADRHWGEPLRGVLARCEVNVTIATSVAQVQRFSARRFSIVLSDSRLFDGGYTDVLTVVRQNIENRSARLMLLANGIRRRSLAHDRLKEESGAQHIFLKPCSPLDVQDFIIRSSSTSVAPRTSSHYSQISPTCLRLVAQVWQSRSTLILRTDKNRYIFYEGALIDSDLNSALLRLLVNDSVLIDSANISSVRGNWMQTGRRLLELAAAPVDSVWLHSNHELTVEVFAGDAALTAFAISEENQDLFTAEEPLSAFSDTEVSIIYALWRLGFVRFNQVRVVVEDAEDVQRLSSVDILRLLESEQARLNGATPIEVLGVGEQASVTEVSEITRRMEERYAGMIEEFSHHQNIVSLAEEMLMKIREAATAVAGGQLIGGQEIPEHEKLHQYGVLQIENGNFTLAEKALRKANSLCIEDAKILGALGWAQAQSP